MHNARAQPTAPAHAAANFALALRSSGILGGVLWLLCIRSYSSRTTYLLHYASQAIVSPRWEVFVPTPLATLVVALGGLALWLGANELLWRRLSRGESKQHDVWTQLAAARHQWALGVGFLVAASVPWLIDLTIHWRTAEALVRATGIWGPTVWQPLWLAAFTGLAADRFARALQTSQLKPHRSRLSTLQSPADEFAKNAQERWLTGSVVLAAVLCGAWWFVQSQRAFDGFMLGFNDCGHFAQRLANTADGRGWLVESPVLPRFWDHFNPGLTLLVPLWIAWPNMSLIFVLQAFALAASAPLVMQLARALGASSLAASLWAFAWLAQPVLGQMNLAYTYGWHPISLAIPLLLVALLCLIKRRWWSAAATAVIAGTMEEGVLVIIATTAATLGAIELLSGFSHRPNVRFPWLASWHRFAAPGQAARRVSGVLPARTWLAIAALATLAFVVVFRFSGLAEFQTGRFHKLGDSALDIAFSPVLRPDVFWGLLLRNRNAIFLLGILIPCFGLALVRAWPLLLAIVLPVGVLLVWDHLPAQSLAFHYPSVLLPMLWLTAIAGATHRAAADAETQSSMDESANRQAFAGTALSLGTAALATSMVASINFGQLPWSGKTLGDVAEVTYDPNSTLQRRVGAADNQFAMDQLSSIRRQGDSVLATGRLATHLVGCSELETVGQFTERRNALAKLTPDEHPLRRYRWLILDRREDFQQFRLQTAALEQEALGLGFRIDADRYDIVVLRRE